MTEQTFYDAVGGHDTFQGIVDRFYAGVVADDVLAPMYPPEDLPGANRRMVTFLEQYWGGPTTYSAERGHPRLRMRHQPYKVNPLARDRWLQHMTAAVKDARLSPMHESELLDYLERAAHSMLNTFED